MKILALVPYCPWPPNTGTRVEMMKHLEQLRKIGDCTIVSARSKPAGFGWTHESISALQDQGFVVQFREDSVKFSFGNLLGVIYAAVCKGLKFEKAFGHSNPYHRWAFPAKWLTELSHGYDLCVMQYGFWAGVKLNCPKAVVVHELLSNYHWEGPLKETRDFAKADLLVVVGHDEEIVLRKRGLTKILWSPPAVQPIVFPDNTRVGLIGAKASQNIEGLRWLERADFTVAPEISIYGNLAEEIRQPKLRAIGRYKDQQDPYNECGIILLTRPDRPGLQIKAVEALAYGRVIIARRGSMRGLPEGEEAWITVDSPDQMLATALRLQKNPCELQEIAVKARAYYQKYLDHKLVLSSLQNAYTSLVKS